MTWYRCGFLFCGRAHVPNSSRETCPSQSELISVDPEAKSHTYHARAILVKPENNHIALFEMLSLPIRKLLVGNAFHFKPRIHQDHIHKPRIRLRSGSSQIREDFRSPTDGSRHSSCQKDEFLIGMLAFDRLESLGKKVGFRELHLNASCVGTISGRRAYNLEPSGPCHG